jgi:hypothetical protein
MSTHRYNSLIGTKVKDSNGIVIGELDSVIVDDGEIFGNISGDFEVSLSGSYEQIDLIDGGNYLCLSNT